MNALIFVNQGKHVKRSLLLKWMTLKKRELTAEADFQPGYPEAYAFNYNLCLQALF